MEKEVRGLVYYRRAIFVGSISLWLGITLIAWFATSIADSMLETAAIILASIVPAMIIRMTSVQLNVNLKTLLVCCQCYLGTAQIVLGSLVLTGNLTAKLYFFIVLSMGLVVALLEPRLANLMTEFTARKRQEESANGSSTADRSSKLVLAKTNLRADYGRVLALCSVPVFFYLVQQLGWGQDALGVFYFVRAALIVAITYNYYRCIPSSLLQKKEDSAELSQGASWLEQLRERVAFTIRAFKRVFASDGHALGWLILLIFIKQTFPWLWYLGPKYVQLVAPAGNDEMIYLVYRALGAICWTASTVLVCYNRAFRAWLQYTSFPESRMSLMLVVVGVTLIWYPLHGTVWALVVGSGIASFMFSAFELAAHTKINVANENDKERVVYAVNSSTLSFGTLMMLPGSWLAEQVGVANAIAIMGSLTVLTAFVVWLVILLKRN